MKYLRRGVWYLASRLLVICLVFGLIITVFYYAMNLTNIQIIVKDGMAGRAKYIMGITTSKSDLAKYFQSNYLDSDPEIAAVAQEKSPYTNYNVRGIDHRLDMGFLWLWPWENAVRVIITERIPRIDGRVKGLKADEVIAKQGQDAIYPPDWPEMTYRALLVREIGQWKIRNLTPVQ